MALAITHTFVSGIADDPDVTLIQPSHWNAAHTLTGVADVVQGGTGLASYAVGDLLYASGATALSKRAAVAVGQVLVSAGVTTAPVWSATPTLAGAIVPNGANPEALQINWADAGANIAAISTAANGGTPRNLALFCAGATLTLGASGSSALWLLQTAALFPNGDNTIDLGLAAGARIKTVAVGTSIVNTGFYEGTEMAAPAAGAANTGRLFFVDNGSGKTVAKIQFATGAAQVVATEP